jgi:hypothetical protein
MVPDTVLFSDAVLFSTNRSRRLRAVENELEEGKEFI